MIRTALAGVCYMEMAPGHEITGSDGAKKVCKVVKPIYGWALAGRRFQRSLFTWLRDEEGFSQSKEDPSLFTMTLSTDAVSLLSSKVASGWYAGFVPGRQNPRSRQKGGSVLLKTRSGSQKCRVVSHWPARRDSDRAMALHSASGRREVRTR